MDPRSVDATLHEDGDAVPEPYPLHHVQREQVGGGSPPGGGVRLQASSAEPPTLARTNASTPCDVPGEQTKFNIPSGGKSGCGVGVGGGDTHTTNSIFFNRGRAWAQKTVFTVECLLLGR